MKVKEGVAEGGVVGDLDPPPTKKKKKPRLAMVPFASQEGRVRDEGRLLSEDCSTGLGS